MPRPIFRRPRQRNTKLTPQKRPFLHAFNFTGARGRAALVSQNERPGVERSPGRVGPDAQSERSDTEHRSRSVRASERNAAVFRLSDKLESGVA